MTETVITLVGALDHAIENKAATLARQVAGVSVRLQTLAPGQAVDLYVPASNPGLSGALRAKLADLGAIDVFVQLNDAFRKKSLLVADMDSTMVEGEILDDLAAKADLKNQVAAITAAGMRGEIDFQESLKLRVALLKGLPVSALAETLTEVKPSKGAATVVKTMARHGAGCVLVSGGFDYFTVPVAAQLGFHVQLGNRFDIHGDHLTGDVILPIVDKDTKKKKLEEEARARQLDLRATIAVGDGANDIPMLQAAGAGVGYFAKPAVQAATPHQIRYTDLTALLFMQGYQLGEFSS